MSEILELVADRITRPRPKPNNILAATRRVRAITCEALINSLRTVTVERGEEGLRRQRETTKAIPSAIVRLAYQSSEKRNANNFKSIPPIVGNLDDDYKTTSPTVSLLFKINKTAYKSYIKLSLK